MGGDFRQLLLVLPGASEPEQVANTILHHYSLYENYMERFALTENMRLLHGGGGADVTHRDWLLNLGSGQLATHDDVHQYAVKLPTHLCMPRDATVHDFVEWIFPDLMEHSQQALSPQHVAEHDDWLSQRAILCSRNNLAQETNHIILEKIGSVH